jgi:uncharacterized protein (DUF2235 family)
MMQSAAIRHRDTVESVGILWSRSLPFTNSNTAIKTFRHALSLDEVSSLIRVQTC